MMGVKEEVALTPVLTRGYEENCCGRELGQSGGLLR
jgi:hypothetical protein